MFNLFMPRKRTNTDCYFISGTGRCGTMLVSKILTLGSNTHCDHEYSIRYAKMVPAYLTGEMEPLYEEIDTIIKPRVRSHNRRGMIYGECSGLLYLVFDEIYRRYREKVRFVLLTRRPETFVRSALARGFFDPNHPNALEHLRARPATEIGRNWDSTSPFEKCLWYWRLVNGMVYDFFLTLPKEMWIIQPIETFDISACRRLYEFLEIEGFEERRAAIEELLATRINATPKLGDDRHLNPWSLPMKTGDISIWNDEQHYAYERWSHEVLDKLYPEDPGGH